MNADPLLNLDQPVGDEVRKTTCYMCACRCGINVHLRDGKVRYIEGNRDHPVNHGASSAARARQGSCSTIRTVASSRAA